VHTIARDRICLFWSLSIILEDGQYNKTVNCPTIHLWRLTGERRYNSYSFTTLAWDASELSASLTSCALPLGKGPRVPTGQEAGWALEPVWTQRLKEESSLPLLGIKPRLPGRPVHSQTLYWLSYPGSQSVQYTYAKSSITSVDQWVFLRGSTNRWLWRVWQSDRKNQLLGLIVQTVAGVIN
jgi:hypothetical protein